MEPLRISTREYSGRTFGSWSSMIKDVPRDTAVILAQPSGAEVSP